MEVPPSLAEKGGSGLQPKRRGVSPTLPTQGERLNLVSSRMHNPAPSRNGVGSHIQGQKDGVGGAGAAEGDSGMD